MSDAVKPPEALPYLPLFMDLTGRPCLVLGSSEAATNKAAPTERRCFATLSTLAARASAELADLRRFDQLKRAIALK